MLCSQAGVAAVRIGGRKDTPIVIDDEEDCQQTPQTKTDPVITEKDTSVASAVPETTVPKTSQQDVIESNARRRPLILEQSPTVTQGSDGVVPSEGLATFYCLMCVKEL